MNVKVNSSATGVLDADGFPNIIASGIGSSHTGDTANTPVTTITIPANTLKVGDAIRFGALYDIDDGSGGAPASTMIARVYVNGTSISSVGTIVRSLSVNKRYVVSNSTTLEGQGNSLYRDEKGTTWQEVPIDITADITVEFNVQLANSADTGHVKHYSIERIR